MLDEADASKLIKINKISLLFRATIVKHDIVINNFERKLMLKILFVRHANYWKTLPNWKCLGSFVIITQLFNVLGSAHCRWRLRRMYEKFSAASLFFSSSHDCDKLTLSLRGIGGFGRPIYRGDRSLLTLRLTLRHKASLLCYARKNGSLLNIIFIFIILAAELVVKFEINETRIYATNSKGRDKLSRYNLFKVNITEINKQICSPNGVENLWFMISILLHTI